MIRVKTAKDGYVLAYKDSKGNEVIMGKRVYLGANDDPKKYYEIAEPVETEPKE